MIFRDTVRMTKLRIDGIISDERKEVMAYAAEEIEKERSHDTHTKFGRVLRNESGLSS
jgi:hypothetical protein